MCVIMAKKLKNKLTNKENWFLYKIRDRNYKPNYKIRYTTSGDVECGFLVDQNTDWTEAVSSNGLIIVNSALQNHDDANAVALRGNLANRDGMIIRTAAKQKSIEKAVKIITEGGLEGCTFVSNGERLFVCEVFLDNVVKKGLLKKYNIDPNSKDAKAKLLRVVQKEDYDVNIHEVIKDDLVVRTNHGIRLDDAGYQPEDGDGYKSSKSRRDIVLKTMRQKDIDHPLEVLSILKNLNQKNTKKDDGLSPIRTEEESDFVSTTALMLTSTGYMFVVPLWCSFEKTSFNRIIKPRGVQIVILPKELPLFESSLKYNLNIYESISSLKNVSNNESISSLKNVSKNIFCESVENLEKLNEFKTISNIIQDLDIPYTKGNIIDLIRNGVNLRDISTLDLTIQDIQQDKILAQIENTEVYIIPYYNDLICIKKDFVEKYKLNSIKLMKDDYNKYSSKYRQFFRNIKSNFSMLEKSFKDYIKTFNTLPYTSNNMPYKASLRDLRDLRESYDPLLFDDLKDYLSPVKFKILEKFIQNVKNDYKDYQCLFDYYDDYIYFSILTDSKENKDLTEKLAKLLNAEKGNFKLSNYRVKL